MLWISETQARKVRDTLSTVADPEKARQIILSALELDRFTNDRRIVNVGQIPIHCEVYEFGPKAPLVIFLPGIGTYVEMYCELLWRLSRLGFNVVGVDPRGHGRSGGRRGLYTVRQVANDVSQVISHMSQELPGPVMMFGSSLGAVLGVACAERDERIRSVLCHTLLLSECPPDLVHLVGWHSLAVTGILWPSLTVDLANLVNMGRLLRGNPISQFLRYDDLIVWDYPAETLASVFNHRSRVYRHELGFRSAILVGDEDELIDINYQRRIVRLMTHPFDLIVMPGGRHMLPFDRVDDTLRAAARWFMRSV